MRRVRMLASTVLVLSGALLSPGLEITLDSVSSAGQGTGQVLTWDHTIQQGDGRILVVGVGMENRPDRPVDTVTYGAQSLTLAPDSRVEYSGSKANATELWYLLSPAVGTAAITVTFSMTVDNGASAAGAVSLFGVNQGPPEAVAAFASGDSQDGDYALSITTQTDRAWLIDVVNNGEGTSTNFVAGPDQTERFDLRGTKQFRVAGSTREVSSAGVVTNTWHCETPTPSGEAHSIMAVAPLKPPSVAIVSPTNNETVSRADLTIVAAAWGGTGITNVDFYADEVWLGNDDTPPYGWQWMGASLGEHVLTARAYDTDGSSATSTPVTIQVVSNLPPRVSITRPGNGMVVSSNLVICADATDDVGVTSVLFYDGDTLLGGDDAMPYRFAWNGAALGGHSLRAVAFDNTGWASTSRVEVTVIVQPVQHVIVISVDGMGSAYVKPLLFSGLVNELTTFKRIQAEGSGTLNARDDPDSAVTLPNHITMMTSRGVLGSSGHNWIENTDPLSTETIAGNKGSYVASAFDVAHDNGLRTGIWSGKSKFSLFQQSYGPESGAPDITGPDNGRDKIDIDKANSYISAAEMTADFTNRMTADPFHFVFFHYQDPDTTGHASGWSTNPASAFAATLKNVDTQIARILDMVVNSDELRGKTLVILTADHGGHGTTHGDTTNPLDFTIPFYVWGANVDGGGDLYAMNPTRRTEPGPTDNPPYSGPPPVHNGDAANLALDVLGLGPVPGSTIGADQDLLVTTLLSPLRSIRMEFGGPVVEWDGSNAWYYTLEYTPALDPSASWTRLSGVGSLPGVDGLMSAMDTNALTRGFYRVRMTP